MNVDLFEELYTLVEPVSCQLVPKLTCTHYQLVPIHLVPKSTRTQTDSKEINKPKNVNNSKNQKGAIT